MPYKQIMKPLRCVPTYPHLSTVLKKAITPVTLVLRGTVITLTFVHTFDCT